MTLEQIEKDTAEKMDKIRSLIGNFKKVTGSKEEFSAFDKSMKKLISGDIEGAKNELKKVKK